jgi:hypothetical protein
VTLPQVVRLVAVIVARLALVDGHISLLRSVREVTAENAL